MPKNKSYIQKLLILAIILSISIGCLYLYNGQAKKIAVPAGFYRVTYVYDGDTIEVDMDGAREKIRMIGVDTPETHHPKKEVECFGQLASEFTKNALDGEVVRLEADETNQNRDRYQRLLRYVYTSDGTLWNEKLLSEGYGHALTAFPFTKMDQFMKSELQAREQNKGLWSACS